MESLRGARRKNAHPAVPAFRSVPEIAWSRRIVMIGSIDTGGLRRRLQMHPSAVAKNALSMQALSGSPAFSDLTCVALRPAGHDGKWVRGVPASDAALRSVR